MLIKKEDFEIYSDYNQFYLMDETAPLPADDLWTNEAFDSMIAVSEKFVAVGTARYETVPVSVEFYDSKPELELEKYSRVNECSFEVTSDKLVLENPTAYFPDAPRIDVEPAIYRVRVLYGNLETVVDDWEGEDFYILQLWKENSFSEVVKLKP